MDHNNNPKIIKSIGITQDNMEMIGEADIRNLSAFINDLIFDALNDHNNMKRILLKKLTALQYDAGKLGFILEVNLKEIVATTVKG